MNVLITISHILDEPHKSSVTKVHNTFAQALTAIMTVFKPDVNSSKANVVLLNVPDIQLQLNLTGNVATFDLLLLQKPAMDSIIAVTAVRKTRVVHDLHI